MENAGKKHLLFVDDEIATRELISEAVEALSNAGYIVDQADSLRETRKRISELKVQGIIVALAVIDGLEGQGVEVDRLLREEYPDIKTLAFSTRPQKFGNDILFKQATETPDGMRWLISAVNSLLE